MRATLIILLFASLTLGDEYHPRSKKAGKKSQENNEDINFWVHKGKDEIERAKNLRNQIIEKKAKNVIIFVGDGMSLPTLTAARIYKAQKADRFKGTTNAEGGLLYFEGFPHVGLSKTYSIDHQTTDSAASANSMFTGVKTNSHTLGFDHGIVLDDVNSEATATKVKSIIHHAQEAGKDTGIVTTTRITHATPAAMYAHTAERDWECFLDLQRAEEELSETVANKTHEIAWQLINEAPGKNLKVMLGGGKSAFKPKEPDERFDYDSGYSWNCSSQGRNFIDEFTNASSQNQFVETKSELMAINAEETDRLLGLFNDYHLLYDHERAEQSIPEYPDSPSLANMTRKAIEMLSKNTENGFVLMVEGGRIDHAHHGTYANRALDETVALDLAVQTAAEMVDPDETLIVVTADHGHTMSMAGYQSRGRDIRSFVDDEDGDAEMLDDDLPYAILSYAQGKGYKVHTYADGNDPTRVNLEGYYVDKHEDGNYVVNRSNPVDMTDFHFRSPTIAPKSSETHSGADVGIFAQGPFAHLFHGVHEQTFIYYVMTYSACLDQFENEPHCITEDKNAGSALASFNAIWALGILILTVL